MSQAAGRVPFADLSRQWREIEAEALPDIRALFESGAFSSGPWVERFEGNVARYLGTAHAVGVNSGTSALHLAMIACGIGPGDQVLVPANTFVATAWAVLYVGAEPVLCDVDPVSWTIDLADAERRLSPGVKAIIPVHLYGQPADMDAVMAFAERHRLAVVEDAAQAIGARFGNRRAGTIGRFGCYSFYPAKNLGAAGEAGLIVTDDAALAERVRALRHHAQSERYLHHELGFNYRMEGMQGLVLDHKLRRVEAWDAQRRQVAQTYLRELADLPLELPSAANGDHVWHLFVVHTPRRDALRAHLGERGIDSGLHYPVPLHRQPCFADRDIDRDSFPNSDRNAGECLSLPLFTGVTETEIARVIEGVRSFFRPGERGKLKSPPGIADWAWAVLAAPRGGKASCRDGKLVDGNGQVFGEIDDGLVRIAVGEDPSIDYYRSIGGPRFHERAAAPFAMSALDTPVYHQYLREIAPAQSGAMIVDVGGGDGRNAMPWLEWGYGRVVVVDAAGEALRRFRDRVAARDPAWLRRILLIEADARALPLRPRCADRVLAIESLYYLNEDYELGLRECRRLLRPDGLLLLSDRDYEAGLLTRLFYGGLDAMLAAGQGREVWDGGKDRQVRSRSFTGAELSAIARRNGLRVIETHGISIVAMLVGFLSQLDRLDPEAAGQRERLGQLLTSLGRDGAMLRAHVLIARRGRRVGAG